MRRSQGIIFVSVLIVMTVVAMLIAAFLTRSRGILFGATAYRDGVRAEQAARGGLNHLLALLESNRNFSSDLDGQLEGASYHATFQSGNPNFSVNNLSGNDVASQRSSQGYKVAKGSADLIVVGQCGHSRRVFRVVVQQGVPAGRSVAAVGRVRLSGEVLIDGVTAASDRYSSEVPPVLDPTGHAPGGILSKYRATAGGPPAIEWVGGPSFTLGQMSRLETAPPESGAQAVSANLQALYPDQIIDQGAADAIPDIDVNATVQSGLANPTLSGGSTINGYTRVSDQRSVAGSLVVNGDLVLSQGTLYVDGDLTVNGGISGLGAVYVSGDVIVNGGNSLVQTTQPSGAALFAGGDVRLQGIDAQGYLDVLAAGDVPFQNAVARLKTGLSEYGTTTSFWPHSIRMAKHYDAWTAPSSQTPWVSPVPGPDGSFNTGRTNGIVPAVLLHLTSDPGYTSDPRAVKIVRALEQLQYHFRHNRHNVPADLKTLTTPSVDLKLENYRVLGWNGSAFELLTQAELEPSHSLKAVHDAPHWDDQDYSDPTTWTHDRIYADAPPTISAKAHAARREAFIKHNPLDLSWLGTSSFQGVVYARGSIHADTKFRILGSLSSLKEIHLNNDTTLIFNQEYLSLFGARLPLGLVHLEEI